MEQGSQTLIDLACLFSLANSTGTIKLDADLATREKRQTGAKEKLEVSGSDSRSDELKNLIFGRSASV